ncbi:Luciferin 4-monooxygenase [Eumeta japonica]|uniref:Luciferin 4-monooxygenase n=1 Tax=Eumeta variegata TaxID=151549 RepID=A0A4C1Z1B1_EUMVA|nr:Luciferin 4-monooxygenase [Eumeta japonica]
MLPKLQELGRNRSIKIHSHLDRFPQNLGDFSEDQGETFHQDYRTMEELYQEREPLGPRTTGEICVKGPVLMKGYVGIPREQYLDEEGFLQTGDLGYYDEDQYVYIVDRIKDVIKYVGFQVSPAELEAVLLQHSAVKEAGVVGRPHPEYSELPTAFVVKQPGVKVTEQELIDFVASQVEMLLGIPIIVTALLNSALLEKFDLSSLKFIYSRFFYLHANTISDLKHRLPHLKYIIQGYGITEVGESTSARRAQRGPWPGSLGAPAPAITLILCSMLSTTFKIKMMPNIRLDLVFGRESLQQPRYPYNIAARSAEVSFQRIVNWKTIRFYRRPEQEGDLQQAYI